MKITKKIISIPPYISTTWANVAALQLKNKESGCGAVLLIVMRDNRQIEVPGLSEAQIEAIFIAHTSHLEEEKEAENKMLKADMGSMGSLINASLPFMNDQVVGIPLKFGGNGGIEGLTGALEHNEAQANLPDLPSEILNKISAIARIVGGEEALQVLPRAEPECNCLHCQIVRAIHGDTEGHAQEVEGAEEEVTEEDLKFRTWDIEKTGENLYVVTNPLETQERYSVYLGKPVGCTCGQAHCEHIKAVLYS